MNVMPNLTIQEKILVNKTKSANAQFDNANVFFIFFLFNLIYKQCKSEYE